MDPQAVVLKLHAFAGAIALGAAPLAMLMRKGGRWHRWWGRTFFYAMVLVCTTALLAGIWRPNPLMALVAFFSFHMALSGYRGLYLKGLHKGQRPGRWDLLMHGAVGLVNTGLLLWGAVHLIHGDRSSTAIIFTVFGAIGCAFVLLQLLRFFRTHHDKQEWLYAHFSGFLGSYIATVSAFSAVNLGAIKPVWLQWLWPSLIGVPFILLLIRYHRSRFDKGERPRFLGRLRIG